MPTYEYVCPKCGTFEQFHSITTQLTQCPTCSSEVRRLISMNNNIIFKGSGFHTTDYRKGDYKTKADGETSTSSSTSTSPGKAMESKSDNTASATPKSESKAS